MTERMSFDQSEEQNREAFIERLVRNGWDRRGALAEWERMQTEDDAYIVSDEGENGIERIMAMIHLAQSGYGGVSPEGRIIDRREFPDARPIPANTLLGVPDPLPVPEGKVQIKRTREQEL